MVNNIITVLFVCVCFALYKANNIEPEYIEHFKSVDVYQDGIYTSQDSLLARLIQSECYSYDTLDQRLVALVVLNRVYSDRFPDSIEEVIYQKGQFDGVNTVNFDLPARTYTLEVAKKAIIFGNNQIPVNVLGYFNPKIATDTSWVSRMNENRYMSSDSHFYHYL